MRKYTPEIGRGIRKCESGIRILPHAKLGFSTLLSRPQRPAVSGAAGGTEELQHRSLAFERAEAGGQPGDGGDREDSGSDLTAEIIYVEMNDGTYSPIAHDEAGRPWPFPLVVWRT
jgi:hypothetical protein